MIGSNLETERRSGSRFSGEIEVKRLDVKAKASTEIRGYGGYYQQG